MIPHLDHAAQRRCAHRPHDETTCCLCEAMPAEAYRRHWMGSHKGHWHVIAGGPDLMARLPRQAHYVTILAYTPGDDGSPACYHGSLYAEWDSHDPAAVLDELRTCLQALPVEYDLPLEALRLWHSGGRGYHLTLPAVVIGAGDGHPQLPRIYRAMVDQLLPARLAPSLDRGVYSSGRGRMWRLPHRRRSDTGRYKVPLAMREVLHKPYAELEALTERPRKGLFWPAEEELSPCAALVQVYQETVATVERQPPRSSRAPRMGPGDRPGLLYHTLSARGWLGQEIVPGKWAVECPWTEAHTTGTPGDSSCVLFAPGPGEELGWWHCSHAHCTDRTWRDVLALFGRAELDQARGAAGLQTEPGLTWKKARAQRLRTQAEETARRILARRRGGISA